MPEKFKALLIEDDPESPNAAQRMLAMAKAAALASLRSGSEGGLDRDRDASYGRSSLIPATNGAITSVRRMALSYFSLGICSFSKLRLE